MSHLIHLLDLLGLVLFPSSVIIIFKGKSPDADWVASFKKRVSDTKFKDRNQEATIYRVPYILKMIDPEAHDPCVVSLGPYHRDKPGLDDDMIPFKWKCLKFVVEQNHSMVLEDYVDRIKNLEKLARDAYSEVGEMNSNSFAEMMLLDGCFVVLTIMRWNIEKKSSSWTQFGRALIERNFKTKISGENTLLAQSAVAVRDIFLLENQLPFFLLETLYDSAFPRGPSFPMLTFEFIRMHSWSNLALPSNNVTFHHIIHLFHACIDPARNHGDVNDDQSAFGNRRVPDLSSIPSATVLHEAGIRLGKKENDKSFLDITFHDGKLEIPRLHINGRTNSLLRSLIAYEQCSMDFFKFHVTSYMMLMNCLISTAADVDLLQQHKIIIGDLGGSQEIATLFNELGTYIGNKPADFYLEDVVAAMKGTYLKAKNTTTVLDSTNDAQDIQLEEVAT